MSVLLVDANNLTMRGIHAMHKSGLSVEGVATGPLLVVINALSRHVREERPTYVVMCWDSGKSAYREGLYPLYKANRGPSATDDVKEGTFALVKEFLALAGIHQVERPGYEADDIIASYVARYRDNVFTDPVETKVVIASSDKDFLMLLGPGVEQIRFASGGAPTDRWTEERVREEFGCGPPNLVDVMALAGDTSDNIPGVPRFGIKTAVKTLAKYDWSLEQAIEDPKIKPHEEQVLISRALVDLTTPHRELNLPALPPFRPTTAASINYSSLESFLLTYRMESVLKRLYAASLWTDTPNGPDVLDRAAGDS